MSPLRGEKWLSEPCVLRAPLSCEVLPAVLGWEQDCKEQDEALISLCKKTPGKQILSANSERPLDFYIYLLPALQGIAGFNARGRQVPAR